MDVNSLLSAFNTQLHISEYAINTLSGFFRFLNNQTNGTKTNVPYGLLVQYDDEKAANVFFKLLNTALKQLSSPVNYRLISFSEKDFCTPSSHRITSSGQIFVLSDFSKEGDLDPVISEFEKTPGFIKIVCASSEIVEKRFKQNEHFFYRILPRHIHLEPLRSQEITEQFLSTFQTKGYKFTEDFKSEIAYYIESIYENANFQNEEFINDLVRRIELSMDEREGISAYKEEASVDISLFLILRLYRPEKQRRQYLQMLIPKQQTAKVRKKFLRSQSILIPGFQILATIPEQKLIFLQALITPMYYCLP